MFFPIIQGDPWGMEINLKPKPEVFSLSKEVHWGWKRTFTPKEGLWAVKWCLAIQLWIAKGPLKKAPPKVPDPRFVYIIAEVDE